MVCFSPLTAWRSKEVGKSGKRGITFDRNASFSGVGLKLPCGQCTGCRLEYSRQWAMRIMHECQLHESSYFATLTYDPNIKDPVSLDYRDYQLFMMRLVKWSHTHFRKGVRFYMCGEYGEGTWRPHFHAVLFGVEFVDKRRYTTTKQGFPLYTSKTLDQLWQHGKCWIGDVAFESAAYVARYQMKKVNGDQARAHYGIVLPDGSFVDRVPEFSNGSRRPGIGRGWYDKFGAHSHALDSAVFNGKEVRLPRYYDTLYDAIDCAALAALKEKRRRKAIKHRKDNTPDRRRVRETVLLRRLALSRRDVV